MYESIKKLHKKKYKIKKKTEKEKPAKPTIGNRKKQKRSFD